MTATLGKLIFLFTLMILLPACDLGLSSISSLSTLFSPPPSSQPNQLNSLALWLDADRGIQLDSQGRVQSWADQAKLYPGNEMSFVSDTPANRPTYPSQVPLLNGMPAVELDGVQQWMHFTGPDTRGIFASLQLTVGMVVVAEPANDGILFDLGWDGVDALGRFLNFRVSQNSFDFQATGKNATQNPESYSHPMGAFESGKAYLLFGIYKYDGSVMTYTNGNPGTLDNQHSYLVNPVSLGSVRYLSIGNHSPENKYFKGKLAELFVYQRDLNIEERRRLECGLALKYRIQDFVCQSQN